MTKTKNAKSQTIKELQERFNDLQHERTRVDTNRENSEKQLATLKAEALEKFGTDDVKQLEKQLKKLVSENEKQRAAYQTQLDEIEMNLVEIEEKFADSDEAYESNE